MSASSTPKEACLGRITTAPHPALMEIIYHPQLADDLESVLPYMLDIDASHVLMLVGQDILPRGIAAKLLGLNLDLREKIEVGQSALSTPEFHRGLYVIYERHYIDQLGSGVGGAAHVGRSRNDINATIARMRARDHVHRVLTEIEDLLALLMLMAKTHRSTLMVAFTHQQPAQPTTLAHYLVAVASELTRSAEWLAEVFTLINQCPMGAAAGTGTAIPVRPDVVAALLGFDGSIPNAVDAVGSRDYLVHALSAFAMVGSTLTRLSVDLQSWASSAYGFVDWTDDLVSTSSIMPQKRNAFVLECIRGRAVHATGALVNCLIGLKNTPFANGIEISGELSRHLSPAFEATTAAVALTRVLLEGLIVRRDKMREFVDESQVTMTALTDWLVRRHGLPFRAAHDAVAGAVQHLGPVPPADRSVEDLTAALTSALHDFWPQHLELSSGEVAGVLDPERCVEATRFGGGPSLRAVEEQLAALIERRARLAESSEARHQSLSRASERLRALVRDTASEARVAT